MPTPSTFQCLPSHIATSIAYYCISTHLVGILAEPDKCDEAKPTWAKLYNVSYSWRVLAFDYFFRELTIVTMTETGTGRLEFRNLPNEINVDTMHYYTYVKQVNIEFPEYPGPSAKIPLQDFSAAWPETLVLPSARTLRFDLSVLYYQQFNKHSPTKNERFYWITQRIKTSLPKLHQVVISDQGLGYMSYRESGGNVWKADEFLSTISGRAASINISTDVVHLDSDYAFIQNGTKLTRLDCFFSDKSDLFSYFIEKFAPTLESLCVNDYYMKNVKSLVLNDKNKPITYPRLRRLEFDGQWAPSLDRRYQLDESISPFPVLQYLSWSGSYIFKDGTLFRGNSRTLEYLSITLDTSCLDVLQRCNVLADGQYPRLVHISLIDAYLYFGSPPLDPNMLMSFAATVVTPAVRLLSLEGELAYVAIVDFAAANPHLANIQVFNLPGIALTFPEMLELVKLFPNMTKLRCDPASGDEGCDINQIRSYISSVYTKYYPLSHRLKYWDASCVLKDKMKAVADSALLLAILCPGFVTVLVWSEFAYEYKYNIENNVGSGVYDSYKDKIQRFLRNTL